jgi:hypothetical protein
LPMLRDYLTGAPWFADSEADARWEAVHHYPSGIPLRGA